MVQDMGNGRMIRGHWFESGRDVDESPLILGLEDKEIKEGPPLRGLEK